METVSITGNRYWAIHIVPLLNVWWAQPPVKWALPFVRPTFVLFEEGVTCDWLLTPSPLQIWGVQTWVFQINSVVLCDGAWFGGEVPSGGRSSPWDFHADGEAQDGVLVTLSAGIAKGFSRHPHTAQATCPLVPAGQWISKLVQHISVSALQAVPAARLKRTATFVQDTLCKSLS